MAGGPRGTATTMIGRAVAGEAELTPAMRIPPGQWDIRETLKKKDRSVFADAISHQHACFFALL